MIPSDTPPGDENDPAPKLLPLNYRSRDTHAASSTAMQNVAHFIAGFGAWAIAVLIAIIALKYGADTSVVFGGLFITYVVMLAACAAISTRYSCPLVLAGIIIAGGLTCLVPLGLVIVACGNFNL